MLHAPYYRRFRRNRDTLAAAAPLGGVHQYCAVCGARNIAISYRCVRFALESPLFFRIPHLEWQADFTAQGNDHLLFLLFHVVK